MLTVHVALPSGRSEKFSLSQSSKVGDLRVLAQKSFQLGFLRLVDADHHVVDFAVSLQAAGIEDGDHLTAIAIEAKVAATERAFALFCPGGDRLVTWGAPNLGGDSSQVQDQLKGVQQVQATHEAFAAILADGSVVTWGSPHFGADSSRVQDRLKDVPQIQASGQAFAAILADESVATWGCTHFGGNSSRVQDQLKDVQRLQASGQAFAAILVDGSVVTWGSPHFYIDNIDSSLVQELKGVQEVQATHQAFAAILADGSVVTWGYPDSGRFNPHPGPPCISHRPYFWPRGRVDPWIYRVCSPVLIWLSESGQHRRTDTPVICHGGALRTKCLKICCVSCKTAGGKAIFPALTPWVRGTLHFPPAVLQDIYSGALVSKAANLDELHANFVHFQKDVQQLQATHHAFAAILAEGSFVTWGCRHHGGDSSAVATHFD